MGNAFDASFAAGGMQSSLDDIIKQKFLQQIESRRAMESQQQMNLQARGQNITAGGQKLADDRWRQDHADKIAANDAANTERNQQAFRNAQMIADPSTTAPTRFAMQYRNATGENAPSELIKEQAPAIPAPNEPVMRVNPRTGKVEQIGDVPHGSHMVQEPAPPSASTHGRFNTTQGSDKDGKPIMIRTNVDSGEVSVLPMPDGVNFAKREQPATQDQTNLGLYANRVEQADPMLTKLTPIIRGMNPAVFAGQKFLDTPYLQSKEVQLYQQAARNMINAVLRRESGAAISPSEFAEARSQYLPVPGDGDEVLAQKAQTRSIVRENFKRGAGPAYRPMAAAPDAAGAAPPDAAARAAELIKKYGAH